MNVKKVLVIGGIAFIWIGGLVVTMKVSNLIGNGIGQACIKATNKLLTLA